MFYVPWNIATFFVRIFLDDIKTFAQKLIWDLCGKTSIWRTPPLLESNIFGLHSKRVRSGS